MLSLLSQVFNQGLIFFYMHFRDSDGAVIRPIPRVKRQISDPGVLPHLSQLLLTFEPGLVERVCTLLWESLRDNPGSAIALLHHTGAVYFALMYTGSNVLPVAKLLHLTHARLGANKNPNEVSQHLFILSLGMGLYIMPSPHPN